jgi:hypothetical protein
MSVARWHIRRKIRYNGSFSRWRLTDPHGRDPERERHGMNRDY